MSASLKRVLVWAVVGQLWMLSSCLPLYLTCKTDGDCDGDLQRCDVAAGRCVSRLTNTSSPSSSSAVSSAESASASGSSQAAVSSSQSPSGGSSASSPVSSASSVSASSAAGSSSSATLSSSVAASSSGGSGLLPGENCGNAVAVTPGQGSFLNQTMVGYPADFLGGAGPGDCAIPGAAADRNYLVTVAPGHRAIVTVTADFNGRMLQPDTCAGICLAATLFTAGVPSPPVIVANSGTEPRAFPVVVLMPAGPLAGSVFDLVVDDAPFLPGENCGTAQTLVNGDHLTGETLQGYAADYHFSPSPGCFVPAATGGDRVYNVTVPPGDSATFTITAAFSGRLMLMRQCAQTCDGASALSANTPRTMSLSNTSAQPQTFSALVTASAPGLANLTYDLSVAVAPPAPGESCSAPLVLVPEQAADNQDVGSAGHDVTLQVGGCTSTATARDRVYQVQVPAFTQVIINANQPTAAPQQMDLVDCGASNVATACLAAHGFTTTRELRWYNNSSTSHPVALVVSDSSLSSEPYSLTAHLVTPPPGEMCELAEENPAVGTPTAGSTTGYGADYATGAGCLRTQGPDRVYHVSMPDQSRLGVMVAGGIVTADVVLSSTGCSPTGWVCGSTQVRSGGRTVVNRSGAARDAYVVVSGYSGDNFTLQLTLVDITGEPPGDACDTAEVLAVGAAAVSGTTQGYANNITDVPFDYPNQVHVPGADHFYRVTQPAGSQLVNVTLTPSAGYAPTLLVTGSCGDNALLVLQPAAGEAVTGLVLPDVFSQDLLVQVDGSGSGGGSYTLSTTAATAPPGDRCADAQLLGTAEDRMDTTAGYPNTWRGTPFGACEGDPPLGQDHWYQVNVAPGRRRTISVQPMMSGFDPHLVALSGPCTTNMTCVGGDASGAPGAVNTVTVDNTTSGSLVSYVVVDQRTAAPGGPYHLTTTDTVIPPPPAGDTCQDPLHITTLPFNLSALDTTPFANNTGNCQAAPGRDVLFQLPGVPAGKTVRAVVTPLSSGITTLASIGTCNIGTCAASARRVDATTPLTLLYRPPAMSAPPVNLWIDQQEAGGQVVDVAVDVVDALPGEDCTSAEDPPWGQGYATTVGYQDNFQGGGAGCLLVPLPSPDRMWQVHVPPGAMLTSSVSTSGFAPAQSVVAAASACMLNPPCLASGFGTVNWTNSGPVEATVFVVVDGVGTPDTGAFSIQLTVN